jgi:hypothetical protein
MAVGSVTSGYAPFQDFGLSTNFHEYLKMFDEIIAYKFDNFIGGHLTDTGTRKDVEITKEYTNDVPMLRPALPSSSAHRLGNFSGKRAGRENASSSCCCSGW